MLIHWPVVVYGSIISESPLDVGHIIGSREKVGVVDRKINRLAAGHLSACPVGHKMDSWVSGRVLDEGLGAGDQEGLAGWHRIGRIVGGQKDASGIFSRPDL